MTNLIITGNGFDIAHSLKTQYNDFRQYLASQKGYVDYNKEYGFPVNLVYKNFVSLCTPDEKWSDFEIQTEKIIKEMQDNEKINLFGKHYSASAISNLKTWVELRKTLTELIEKNIGDYALTINSSELIQSLVDDIVNSALVKEYSWIPCLYQIFQQWIQTISYEDNKKLFLIDNNDIAISFNYTATLEKIYSIKNILHIHGSVENVDKIVLGFNSEKLDAELPGLNEMYTSSFKELKRASRDAGVKSTGSSKFYQSNIGRFYKPVHQLKNNIINFLEDKHFEEIVVIGHSYNDIDFPYFKELLNNYPRKKYIFTYYNHVDKLNAEKMIDILGNINKCKIVDVNEYLIQ